MITLRNDQLEIDLCPETGALRGMRDTATGSEWLTPGVPARLFRLISPVDGCYHPALEGVCPVVTHISCGCSLEYEIEGIWCLVTLTLDGGALEARMTVENGGTRTVEEIMFLFVCGIAPFPGARVVKPDLRGRVIDDPFGKGLGGDHRVANHELQKKASRYPHTHTTAWIDLGCETRGLGIEARHTDFSITDFYLHKVIDKSGPEVGRTLEMATVFPHRVEPGGRWESPPVRITPHEGDWHVTADRHRAWLETWMSMPDPNPAFRASAGWHFYFMKQQDGLELFRYEDLPRMARAAKAVGMPWMLLFGWHEAGHDNHYCYRYLPNEAWGGLAALRRGLDEARAGGVGVIPFYNGTLADPLTPGHRDHGHAWEATSRTGHPYHAGDWSHPGADAPGNNRARLHVELCPCGEMREHFLEDVRRIVHDYGFGSIHLDQGADKMYLCHNAAHVHPRPDLACVEGFGELLPRSREIVKEAGPGGIMLVECANDFACQWADGNWTWNMPNDPEPVLYSLPWVSFSHELDALEYEGANRCFVHNVKMDLRIDGGFQCVTDYPEFADHLKRLADLRQRAYPWYAGGLYRDREGITDIEEGTALARCYFDPATGRSGVAMAEVTGAPTLLRFRLEGQVRPTALLLSVLHDDRTTCTQGMIDVRLKAYEAAVLCMDPI